MNDKPENEIDPKTKSLLAFRDALTEAADHFDVGDSNKGIARLLRYMGQTATDMVEDDERRKQKLEELAREIGMPADLLKVMSDKLS